MTDQETKSNSDMESEDESGFFDFLLVMAKYKKLVIGLPLAAGIVALIVSFLLPNWYTATTKIMPPQQSQSNAVAILGHLRATPARPPSQPPNDRHPRDLYVPPLQ